MALIPKELAFCPAFLQCLVRMAAGRLMTKQRLLVVGFFAIVVLPVLLILQLMPQIRKASEARRCVSKLVAIISAEKQWAAAHDQRLPDTFLALSNQLGSPAYLICPKDRYRQPAPNWSLFSAARSSYTLTNAGTRMNSPDEPLVTCSTHGFVGYADDTVFDGIARRRMNEGQIQGTPLREGNGDGGR